MLYSTSRATTNHAVHHDSCSIPNSFDKQPLQLHHYGSSMSSELTHGRPTYQYYWNTSGSEQNAYLQSHQFAPVQCLQPHQGAQLLPASPGTAPSPQPEVPTTSKPRNPQNLHYRYQLWDATAPAPQHNAPTNPAFWSCSHSLSHSTAEGHPIHRQCDQAPLYSQARTISSAKVLRAPSAPAAATNLGKYGRPGKDRRSPEVSSAKPKAVLAPAASTRNAESALHNSRSSNLSPRIDVAAVSSATATATEVPLSQRPPVNLSAIVKENMPPWCITARGWKESGLRLRLSIMAVSWFLVHEHGYDAVFDRNGKVWVRKGRPVVIPLGGQRVNFGFVHPPPKTYWAESVCLSVCDVARNSRFPITCPEAIGCIAAYEGTPVDQVKHAMLPVGLFNSFTEDAPSGSGLKVVNGWMVFRSK